MTLTHPQDIIHHTDSVEKLRSITRAAIAVCVEREGEDFDLTVFNAHCTDAARRMDEVTRKGFAYEFTCCAINQALQHATTHHHQISKETLEWGGFLSGDRFTTTEKYPAMLRDLMARARA